jgi:hypothetical protein
MEGEADFQQKLEELGVGEEIRVWLYDQGVKDVYSFMDIPYDDLVQLLEQSSKVCANDFGQSVGTNSMMEKGLKAYYLYLHLVRAADDVPDYVGSFVDEQKIRDWMTRVNQVNQMVLLDLIKGSSDSQLPTAASNTHEGDIKADSPGQAHQDAKCLAEVYMVQSGSVLKGSGRQGPKFSRGNRKGLEDEEKPSGIEYKSGRFIPKRDYKKLTSVERKEHKDIVGQRIHGGKTMKRPTKKRHTKKRKFEACAVGISGRRARVCPACALEPVWHDGVEEVKVKEEATDDYSTGTCF